MPARAGPIPSIAPSSMSSKLYGAPSNLPDLSNDEPGEVPHGRL